MKEVKKFLTTERFMLRGVPRDVVVSEFWYGEVFLGKVPMDYKGDTIKLMNVTYKIKKVDNI